LSGGTYYIDYNDRFPSQFPEQSASVVIYKPRYQPDVIIAKVQSDSHMGYEELTRGVAGKDDEDVINAANDFVKENGGSIFLRAGEYIFDSIDVYGGIIGETGTVFKGTVHLKDKAYIHRITSNVDADHQAILIEGSDYLISECDITAEMTAIAVTSSDYSGTVMNTKVVAGSDLGSIPLAVGDSSTVINSYFNNISSVTINHAGKNCIIIGNAFINGVIYVKDNSVVSGNYISGTSGGIEVSTNCIVTNNFIVSNASPHIFGVTDGCVVQGNVHVNSSTTAVEAVAIDTNAVPTNAVIKDYITVGTFTKIYSEYVFTATVTGDGTTTAFNFAHNLFNTPTKIIVHPNTSADVMPDSVTADATNVTLSFTTAPAAGTTYNYTIYAEV